jgi:hypothetical protein
MNSIVNGIHAVPQLGVQRQKKQCKLCMHDDCDVDILSCGCSFHAVGFRSIEHTCECHHHDVYAICHSAPMIILHSNSHRFLPLTIILEVLTDKYLSK